MTLSSSSKAKLLQLATSWAVAFPTITVLLALLNPVMADWPLIARTLLLTLVMVPMMSITTPALLKWLQAAPRHQANR